MPRCASQQIWQPMSLMGLVSRVTPVHTALRNCTRDEGRSFEVGNQVLISSHRKLLLSKAMVVNVAVNVGGTPLPPKATFDETKNLAEALARGAPDAGKIARNIHCKKCASW